MTDDRLATTGDDLARRAAAARRSSMGSILPHGNLGGEGDWLLIINGRVARARPDVTWQLGCEVINLPAEKSIGSRRYTPTERKWWLRLERDNGAWAEVAVFSVRQGAGRFATPARAQQLVHITVDLDEALAELDRPRPALPAPTPPTLPPHITRLPIQAERGDA